MKKLFVLMIALTATILCVQWRFYPCVSKGEPREVAVGYATRSALIGNTNKDVATHSVAGTAFSRCNADAQTGKEERRCAVTHVDSDGENSPDGRTRVSWAYSTTFLAALGLLIVIIREIIRTLEGVM